MILPGFCNGSYVSQSPLADCEKTINWAVENIESTNGTSKMALYPTPGVSLLGTASLGPGSAHFSMFGREWAVIGGTFYEISQAGAFTTIGSVAVGTLPATISSNGATGNQLMITSGATATTAGNVYIFTLNTNAFAQISSMNGLATVGDQLDGFFLALNAQTATVYISNLNDGTTWVTGLNFFKRNIAPDPWISMKVANHFIWLMGTYTSEIWWDAGTSPVPFAPYNTGIIPYGCAAQFSPCVANGSLVWVAQTKDGSAMVVQASGFTPTPISTYALSYALTQYPTVADAVGDTYTDLGHTYYLLSFPTAGTTICYDANTQQWHDRGTWISNNGGFSAWRPRFHAYAFGQHRMLDATTGELWQMGSQFTSDVDGNPIRRVRVAPPLYYQNQRLFVSALEVAAEIGLGLNTGQGSNPQFMLRISKDGAKTWGNERARSAGEIGTYRTRIRWNQCGMARRMVFEISVTDPIPWRLMDAMVELRQPPARLSQMQQAQWSS